MEIYSSRGFILSYLDECDKYEVAKREMIGRKGTPVLGCHDGMTLTKKSFKRKEID